MCARTPPETGPPTLAREAIREIDRRAIEEFGIPGVVLMENAAIGLFAHLERMLDGLADHDANVTIVCGRGNNGGDGWALARHAANAGIEVRVIPLGLPRPSSDAGINERIAERMGIVRRSADDPRALEECDIIVDAIFGTGLDRDVAGPAAEWIGRINASRMPVLAVDVPSGLDCDTGQPLGAAVIAACTVTFVARKPGFGRSPAPEFLGDVHVIGIGAPQTLVRSMGSNADR